MQNKADYAENLANHTSILRLHPQKQQIQYLEMRKKGAFINHFQSTGIK